MGITALVILAFVAGYLVHGGDGGRESIEEYRQVSLEQNVREWTCSMHPQIRQPEPGRCPICGMEFVPVTTDEAGKRTSPRELTLSPYAEKLAEVRVAPVERKSVEKVIRLLGKVVYDETGLRAVTAWFPGRIERLYVDYTGRTVRKGEKLAELYSPELFNAWEELVQAQRSAVRFAGAKSSPTGDVFSRAVEAVREKLRLLGLNEELIRKLERSEKPPERIPVFSTAGGVVVRKNAVEGMYVTTGTELFTVADLSKIWVLLDVYESELEWMEPGQEVSLVSEAYPGEVFKGKVSFIDPELDESTRTVKVRVEVPNRDGRLKPGMFVRAKAAARPRPGGEKESAPLVIPATAPLVTGKRAVVYVKNPAEPGTYEGREIVLGHRLGDYYEVKEGLREGELVVVNGNFKIDSAVQILARQSMMNPVAGAAPQGHHHGRAPAKQESRDEGEEPEETSLAVPDAFRAQLDSVYAAYFRVQRALSHDSLEGAKKESKAVLEALDHVDMTLLDHESHMAWMKELKVLAEGGGGIGGADSIDDARKSFKSLSDALIRVARSFGTTGNIAVYRFHCPMAFDNKGSDWLQDKPEIENPWFGSSMLKCGTLEETISPGHGGHDAPEREK